LDWLPCSNVEESMSSQFRNAAKKPQQGNLSNCRHGKSVHHRPSFPAEKGGKGEGDGDDPKKEMLRDF